MYSFNQNFYINQVYDNLISLHENIKQKTINVYIYICLSLFYLNLMIRVTSRLLQIQVYDREGNILCNLSDPEVLGSVCSLNVFHPTQNVLVGGNSSGRVHVFM